MIELVAQRFQEATFFYATHMDETVAFWFRDRLTTATRADLFLSLSVFGSEPWVAGLLLTLLAYLGFKRHWQGFFTLMLTVPLGSFLGQALKYLFRRQRPFIAGPWGDWGGYSFPSGHTLAATLLYAALLLILLPLLRKRRWRIAATVTAGITIIGVALSRIALGAHYLTDVLGAMIFGVFWAALCALAVEFYRSRQARLIKV